MDNLAFSMFQITDFEIDQLVCSSAELGSNSLSSMLTPDLVKAT